MDIWPFCLFCPLNKWDGASRHTLTVMWEDNTGSLREDRVQENRAQEDNIQVSDRFDRMLLQDNREGWVVEGDRGKSVQE